MATSELGYLKVELLCLNRTDSRGVLSCLQNPLCHMSTIRGASWMGRESSPGAQRKL